MPLLTLNNLVYRIGMRTILEGATLTLEPGERVGLVGRNGTGKSTLLKIAAGILNPDAGAASLARGSRAGYLRQDPDLDPDAKVRDEAAAALAHLDQIHADLDALFHRMAGLDPADPELPKLLTRQADLQHRLEQSGGYATDHRVEAVLHGLGFEDAQFDLPTRVLSGGQRGRLALARLLLDEPELALLDEPTNHLDIAGREWLETFLSQQFRGAVLMVSHDRRLLDRVVSRIVELEDGRLVDYPGSYTAFAQLRARRRLSMLRAYENQQTKFRQEQAYIDRYRAGQRAKQARGRETKLHREMRDGALERPPELAELRLTLPKAPRAGDIVASLRGVGVTFQPRPGESSTPKTVFRNLDLTIARGERWAIIGPNGAGKSTLIRTLLSQQTPTAGTARLGSSVAIGYFSQVASPPDPETPVYRYIADQARRENPDIVMSEQEARDLAGAFLFTGRTQETPVGNLSGGEFSRARLAAILASAKNLLILDEPTNHLDIPSAERLEEILRKAADPELVASGHADPEPPMYEGTLLLVSHDRALIDATCDHLLILDGHGGHEIFHGTYAQWKARQAAGPSTPSKGAAAGTSSKPAPQGARPSAAAAPADDKPARKSRLSWMPMERLETEIAQAEAKLRELDQRLASPEVYSDAARSRQAVEERAAAQRTLDELEEEWLHRSG